jgi:hypothetical protein
MPSKLPATSRARWWWTAPTKPDFTGLALGYSTSGAEQVAEWAKGAKVYKAFQSNRLQYHGQSGFRRLDDDFNDYIAWWKEQNQ